MWIRLAYNFAPIFSSPYVCQFFENIFAIQKYWKFQLLYFSTDSDIMMFFMGGQKNNIEWVWNSQGLTNQTDQPALFLLRPYSCPAPVLFLPCSCLASVLLLPCSCLASVLLLPCSCLASAPILPCSCTAPAKRKITTIQSWSTLWCVGRSTYAWWWLMLVAVWATMLSTFDMSPSAKIGTHTTTFSTTTTTTTTINELPPPPPPLLPQEQMQYFSCVATHV